MRKAIVLVVVLLGAAAAFYAYHATNAAHDDGILALSGNIEVTDVTVSFQVAGRIVTVLADEGELVRQGDTIAILDDAELRRQVAVQEADVEALGAQLKELEAGSLPQEVAASQAILQAAVADEKRAADDLVRLRSLVDQNVIARRDYDAGQAAAEMARARVREARERLSLVRQGPRAERLELARARLHQAMEAVALSRTRLAYTVVRAPISGVVLSRSAEPGEYAAPGATILAIGDLEQVWLRAYVDETDLGRIRVGQRARVRSDTFRDREYEGTLSFISPEAEFTPRTVQTEKERVKLVYRIKIAIANPRMELKPGMPAEASIVLDDRTDSAHGGH